MVTTVQEQRRQKRYTRPVCAWLMFRHEPSAIGTVSVDVSLEGGRFCALEPVAAGTPVLVYLQLRPGTFSVECKGRVCWSRQMADGLEHFGVRFLDLSEPETEELAAFLAPGRTIPVMAAV
ncbi:MAG: PilZ domain-containing protein [Candidatus Hydrogenedentes bacterium]|nr:PilZ domain-containing protein [Candidatus Hydrogenedentota bacterium]